MGQRLTTGFIEYDLDSLRSIAERALEARKREAENCHSLIESFVHGFWFWIGRTLIESGEAVRGLE